MAPDGGDRDRSVGWTKISVIGREDEVDGTSFRIFSKGVGSSDDHGQAAHLDHPFRTLPLSRLFASCDAEGVLGLAPDTGRVDRGRQLD